MIARVGGRRLPVAVLVVAVLLLFAAAHRIDHDESQYVAAVALMRGRLPFRDFAYLQAPLQPLLFAPLAWLRGVPLLPVLRALNAVAVALGAAAVAAAVRAGGGDRRVAAAAGLLMLASAPLLFAGAVARNDALPMLFESVGIWLLLRAIVGESDTTAAAGGAGIAFWAAASTKISYGLPALTASGAVLLAARRIGWRGVAAFLAGGVAGAAPTIGCALAWPEAFRFEVFDYAVAAPAEWRGLTGERALFSPFERIARPVEYLLPGPAVVAIALVIRRRIASPAARLLEALILAGAVAAVLPQPTYRQYLVPLLPPLFARLGLVPRGAFSRGWRIVLAAGALAGLASSATGLVKAVRRGLPVVAAARDARWVAARTAGPVASLSPERVAGLVAIDPRFAAGPFLFRTVHLLDAGRQRAYQAVIARDLDRAFAAAPPAAILTGGERRGSRAAPHGLDAPLDAWAAARGWDRAVSPDGVLTLWAPPQRGFRSAAGAAIAPAKR